MMGPSLFFSFNDDGGVELCSPPCPLGLPAADMADDGRSDSESSDSESSDEQRLFRAAKTGDLEEVRRLLRAGVDVNARNEYGYTALIVAASYGHPAVVEVLLEKGANGHAKDESG